VSGNAEQTKIPAKVTLPIVVYDEQLVLVDSCLMMLLRYLVTMMTVSQTRQVCLEALMILAAHQTVL
jgi:hypothetical protein